jgi:hypothetical protein
MMKTINMFKWWKQKKWSWQYDADEDERGNDQDDYYEVAVDDNNEKDDYIDAKKYGKEDSGDVGY